MEIIVVLLLLIPAMAWDGFVISTLWSWFVVPLGVVPIGVWHAAGLAVLTNYFKNVNVTQNEHLHGIGVLFVGALISLVALIFGWIAYMFMV